MPSMPIQKLTAFARGTLTDTEGGYAQTEKELPAVLFGMGQFHQFTFGHKVDVQSDHQSLQKHHEKATVKYTQVTTVHLIETAVIYDTQIRDYPGKSLLMANTLSREYIPEEYTDGCMEEELESINLLQHLDNGDGGSRQSNKALDRMQCYRQ